VLDEEGDDMSVFRGSSARLAVLVVMLAITPVLAASIPAWLDDGISRWNAAHPDAQFRFVDIKDSFVWYDRPKTPEIGQQTIRERINGIVLAHGYAPTDDEEMITTAKPPVTSGKVTPKKCWSRSFVMSGQAGSPGNTQRMLTTLVCEDAKNWWAAFRIAD